MNFKDEVEKLGYQLNEAQLKQFDDYYEMLISVNEKMNLTAITEKEEVYRKHFLDSLELLRVLPAHQEFHLCDVGSGAGFPAIPLAIVFPKAHFTILDALNKRILFLNAVIKQLHLDNVVAIHERAEDYLKKDCILFDYVTARAVARLNILVELCLPLVKVGGKMLAMKGSSGKEELALSEHAISILGGQMRNIIEFELPKEHDLRFIIEINKEKQTPKGYPRSFAKIKEKPL